MSARAPLSPPARKTKSSATPPTPLKTGARSRSVQQVLDALGELQHPSAYDIQTWLQQQPQSDAASRNISLTTIYRVLNKLVEDHTVRPVHFRDGQQRYDLTREDDHHHHHLICTGCHGVEVIEECPVTEKISHFPSTFAVQYHILDVYGLCHPCQRQK